MQTFHITARCNNKDGFGLPPSKTWRIFSDYLNFISSAFNVKIHGFILMTNHFHLVASFPDNNRSISMNYFLSQCARAINHDRSTINHVFGRRYHACEIVRKSHLRNTLKYLFLNPVKAGIVDKIEDYRFSNLYAQLGEAGIYFPIYDIEGFYENLFRNTMKQMELLNRHYKPSTSHKISEALRRERFSFNRYQASRQPKLIQDARPQNERQTSPFHPHVLSLRDIEVA